MDDLNAQLDEWFKQIQEAALLNNKEKGRIAKAGALVLKEEIQEVARRKHYSKRKGDKHMADHVIARIGNLDGKRDGTATVGWTSNVMASNARRLNDGTKKYQADHWLDNIRDSKSVQEKIFKAEQQKYEEIMRGKQ